MVDLDTLNEQQKQAVLTTNGPLLILAGAGSGKTRVITQRAAYLVEEMGVDPWNILCITFTNKAAREMRERIDAIIGHGASEVWVSTFHSLCLKILFRYADRIGYDPQFEICDTSDQKSIIKDVCKRLNIDTKMFKERTLLNAISSAKDELIDPVAYREQTYGDFRKQTIARVYTEYQSTLKKNNSFDFDDLIMQTVRLLKQEPDVLAGYQERFKYIMVDEYQDTNTAQFELIHQLALKYKNLCVVGDDDQSIYKFRGANIYNILDFEKTYPDATVVKLEQNYRSTQNILNAANEVIANNRGRKVKRLWTSQEEGESIHFKQLDNAQGEAMYVAESIKKLVNEKGVKYGDCAILMRTNIQSKEFEDAFRLYHIDYDLVKGLRFWDTKVIKDITSYILTVASGQNDLRTSRIINVPKRGIGNTSVEKLQEYAFMREISLMEACEYVDDVPGLSRAAEKIKSFSNMILSIREKLNTISYAELVDEILDETDYLVYLDDEADTPEKYQEMCDYIDKLKDALTLYEEECRESGETPDIVDFMRQNGVEGNNINSSLDGGQIGKTLTKEEEEELREKKVLIMTMHNAKGLEFPYVFLVGMEDGLFPSYMTITNDDQEELEEERRLCYVALTRAKKSLTITCARSRMVNGETRYSKTSRFVKEIPFGLLDMSLPEPKIRETDRPDPASYEKAKQSFFKKPGYGSLDNSSPFGKKKVAVKKKVTAQNPYGMAMKGSEIQKSDSLDYTVGDRVKHIKFGVGTVLDIKDGGRDYEITVDFDEAGVRKMFAGFAKLVKM